MGTYCKIGYLTSGNNVKYIWHTDFTSGVSKTGVILNEKYTDIKSVRELINNHKNMVLKHLSTRPEGNIYLETDSLKPKRISLEEYINGEDSDEEIFPDKLINYLLFNTALNEWQFVFYDKKEDIKKLCSVKEIYNEEFHKMDDEDYEDYKFWSDKRKNKSKNEVEEESYNAVINYRDCIVKGKYQSWNEKIQKDLFSTSSDWFDGLIYHFSEIDLEDNSVVYEFLGEKHMEFKIPCASYQEAVELNDSIFLMTAAEAENKFKSFKK